MLVNSNKYRRKKKNQAGSLTIESGDTLTINSGGTLVNSGKETVNNETVTAANVITAAESGKTFFLSLAGGFTSTLPAPAAGLYFKFVVKTAPTTAYVITTDAGANVIYGLVDALGAATEANGVKGQAQDTVNLVANQAAIGDFVEFVSDGTNWYVSGAVAVVAGLTFAVT